MCTDATVIPKPLFRDPIHDGAADPCVIWNRAEQTWWMIYTNRRAFAPPSDDVAWVHGTDLGIASSDDGGLSWLYRGIVEGLNIEPGRHTYWAPEILDDGQTYHMYVSVIRGVPTQWAGHERRIRHYTSPDLLNWRYESTLNLNSERVIDSCVFPLPSGGYRMWFKDEAAGSHTYYADSTDLYSWTLGGPAVTHAAHEGVNVFELDGHYWMIIDEWCGQRVLSSEDLNEWTFHGRILAESGSGPDDQGNGLHADVVVVDDSAYIFYFTHPGRASEPPAAVGTHAHRRSSIQVARAHVVDGQLRCDRDEPLTGPILPRGGPHHQG